MGESRQTANERSGRFLPHGSGSQSFAAFHPKPLPPAPRLDIDAELQDLLDRANQALGRLDGITLLLPDPGHFLYSYIRKEAVLSSQIEGTQSSLSDLLLFEHNVAPGVPLADVEETSNYIAAMNHGLREIDGGRPLSLRLLKEVHGLLLRGRRGGETGPGEFRRVQNWLGGPSPSSARFVPPPANEVLPAMSDLEKFLHDDPAPTPILIKAALAHAQFETIHPFLDGNGRVGRLLVTLLLCAERKVLSQPLLYLSLYLKRNRDDYYDRLQRTRTDGAWEEWLAFFLRGVIDVAATATDTTRRIVRMIERDRARIETELKRAAGSALRVHHLIVREMALTIPYATSRMSLSEPTVTSAIGHLETLGMVREATGRRRGRVYIYDEYLSILSEGTERRATAGLTVEGG